MTEAVYREELLPVIQTGARVMDSVFLHVEVDPLSGMEALFSVAEAMGREPA
ncbi:hypothetical protein [Cellulomonas sp. NS3]|uniref:hypothetical protein n=1 Tax=Cellulomonas sp. NS3 TaxID=2973977 RepID=UPI002162EC0E|nr:hypothetical protein [Cellulomonas sp. NS3]